MKRSLQTCLLLSHVDSSYEAATWRSDDGLRKAILKRLDRWFRNHPLPSARFDYRTVVADIWATPMSAIRQMFFDSGWSYCGYRNGVYKAVCLYHCQRRLKSLAA
jgi:hypothetical protein